MFVWSTGFLPNTMHCTSRCEREDYRLHTSLLSSSIPCALWSKGNKKYFVEIEFLPCFKNKASAIPASSNFFFFFFNLTVKSAKAVFSSEEGYR